MSIAIRLYGCHPDCSSVGSHCLITAHEKGSELTRAECVTCSSVLSALRCDPDSNEWNTLVDIAIDHERWHLSQTDKEGTTMTPTTDECVPPTGGTQASLLDAMENARLLNVPGEVNEEYVRGQAELICDMFGIPSDPGKDIITAVISHEATSAAELIVWMTRNEWLR